MKVLKGGFCLWELCSLNAFDQWFVKLILEHRKIYLLFMFSFSEAYMLRLISWVWYTNSACSRVTEWTRRRMWCAHVFMSALFPWASRVLEARIFALKMHPQVSQGFGFLCLSLKLHLLSHVVIISAYCVFFIPSTSLSRYLSPCYHLIECAALSCISQFLILASLWKQRSL